MSSRCQGRPRFGMRRIALALFLAVLLVCAGALLIRSRGELHAGLTPDDVNYLRLASGHDGAAPWKFRVLGPDIARVLPTSASEGLRLVTFSSLIGVYTLTFLICLRLRVRALPALGALLMAFTATGQLAFFNDPLLIDGLASLFVTVAIWALLVPVFAVFAGVLIVGVAARESVLVLAPAWAVRNRPRAIGVLGAGLAAYVAIHLAVGGGALTGENVERLHHLRQLFVGAAESWGFLWLLVPVGLYLLVRERPALTAATIFLTAGGILATFVATDVSRMFLPLFPIVVVCTAVVIEHTYARRPSLALALFAVGLANLAFAPSVVTGTASAPARAALTVLGGLAATAAAWSIIRRETDPYAAPAR